MIASLFFGGVILITAFLNSLGSMFIAPFIAVIAGICVVFFYNDDEGIAIVLIIMIAACGLIPAAIVENSIFGDKSPPISVNKAPLNKNCNRFTFVDGTLRPGYMHSKTIRGRGKRTYGKTYVMPVIRKGAKKTEPVYVWLAFDQYPQIEKLKENWRYPWNATAVSGTNVDDYLQAKEWSETDYGLTSDKDAVILHLTNNPEGLIRSEKNDLLILFVVFSFGWAITYAIYCSSNNKP
jgi:hypothetical protein